MNFGTLVQRQENSLTVQGQIESGEEFFQDHFPGFPVLPGVLMIEILRQSAKHYFPEACLRLAEMRNVRFANFLRPGDKWESRVEFLGGDENLSEWKGQLSSNGRPVCSARFKLQKDQ
jgi:3-hydroxyacyl-[acyl-carrier-protein] dehydratase